MALTEVQLPSKTTFYAKLNHAANQMNKVMNDEFRRKS